MELFRVVCMIRPETASPAPAMIAASTRGIRIFQIMRIWEALPVLCSAAMHSLTVILEEPTNRQTMLSTTTARSIVRIIPVFLRFLFFSPMIVSISCIILHIVMFLIS